MISHITINSDDGDFRAYVAYPGRSNVPAVVVLHEVFGVNADMRQTCSELAAAGFLAVCPDLFWRLEPGIDLSVTSEADWKKALSLYAAFDRDKGRADIVAAASAAAGLEGASGKVGLLGFCLGGLMTFLALTRKHFDAAVMYHGAETEKYLGEADRISTPMLMHLAKEDEFISKDAQHQIKAALAGRPNVEIYSYGGCQHGFARHKGAHYDANAAALANGRTLTFLRRHLG